MLDQTVINTVKSTAPLLAQTGTKLTAHFYDRLFKHNPELKNIFNMSNQENGRQREALFQAIYGYAANIDNIEALLPVVNRIAHKHASFNIQPEMYDIVGNHLLGTIQEMFDPGQEVLDAWAQAYQFLAKVFISYEANLYREQASTEGGWLGTRPFRVVKKTRESNIITSFELEPEDGRPVIAHKPGQYIAVFVKPDGWEYREIRQYSLSIAPNTRNYRISVRRENQGIVSAHLHENVNEGDILQLTPPFGEFSVNVDPEATVVLISGGVGLTPLMSMLYSLLDRNHAGEIHWVHAAEHSGVDAFRDELKERTASYSNVHHHVWYRVPQPGDVPGVTFDHTGIIDLNLIRDRLNKPGTQFYLCGPLGFMEHVGAQLKQLAVAESNIHYECFGPHKPL